MTTYKIITRKYYESYNKDEVLKIGKFIARGQWADGHLAYSRLDENNNPIEEDECSYVQLRSYNGGLYMQRI